MKLRGILMLTLIVLLPTSIVHAKSYTLPYASVSYIVNKDGSVSVMEKVDFSFRGTFHWVKRYIYLKEGTSVRDIQVGVIGGKARFIVGRSRHGFYCKAIFSRGISNKRITLLVAYRLIGVVQVFRDISQLYPKVWGEGWKKRLQRLDVKFQFPNRLDRVKYYVHPSVYLKGISKRGNTLLFVFNGIPAGVFQEIRLLMPVAWFANAKFATRINKDAIPQIERIERRYVSTGRWLSLIGWLLIIIAILVPIIIYFTYGREPRIDYHGIYEREIPYKDPPAKVNAIMMGKVGIPTVEGVLATVMELVRQKFISFRGEDEEGIYISFLKDEDKGKLQPYERFVLDKIKEMCEGGRELPWKEFASKFSVVFPVWKDMVSGSIDVKKYFYPTGNTLLKVFGTLSVAIAIIGFFYVYFSSFHAFYPIAYHTISVGLGILFVSGLVSLLMPDKVAGRWTKYGLTYYKKWQRFKSYLTDFSMLKEYPPESIAIWEIYLVYATALGVARKVIKHMKMILPQQFSEEEINMSPFYVWYMYPLLWDTGWHSTFAQSVGEIADVSFSDIGDIGDIGGGFGGGGGDAG